MGELNCPSFFLPLISLETCGLTSPYLSLSLRWNTIYSYMVSLPAELVAAAILVDFWSSINNAVWITIFGLLLIASNSILVRIYGELEFFFASLKILLIVGVNIMALVIVCGGGPDHHTYGFQYWRRPGPLVQYLGIEGSTGRFLGEFFLKREWCWVELIYWLPTNFFVYLSLSTCRILDSLQ